MDLDSSKKCVNHQRTNKYNRNNRLELFSYTLPLVFFAVACVSSSDVTFDNTNFFVTFIPKFLEFSNASEITTGLTMVQFRLVIKRFSKIVLSSDDFQINNMDTDAITSAVTVLANLNRDLLSSGTKQNSRNPKYEAMLKWDITTTHSKFEESGQTAMTHVNTANSIYNNTIQALILDCASITAMLNITFLKPRISFVRNLIINSGYALSLEIIFPYVVCLNAHELEAIRSFVHLVDKVHFQLFYWLAEQAGETNGLDYANEAITRMKTCKNNFLAKYPSTVVGFVTGFWDSKNSMLLYKGYNLVTFWKTIYNWMEQSNSSIIMYQAFDTRTPFVKHSGWWRIPDIDSYSLLLMKQEVYDEKNLYLSAPATITTTDIPSQQSSQEYKQMTTLAIAALATTIILFVIILVIMYKRFIKKVHSFALSKSEIREFFEGNIRLKLDEKNGDHNYAFAYSAALPYNKLNYELQIGTFIVEKKRVLGKGAYGIVFGGFVLKEDKTIPAAVKCLTQGCSKAAKRGLLLEIKVLSYLGTHENILKLLGAYTEKLTKGKVYVFTELYGLGSLESFLKRNKTADSSEVTRTMTDSSVFTNLKTSSDTQVSDISSAIDNTEYDIQPDMKRWCYEIANGMEYLVSKKVVHADLATRNVVLTVNKQAKIADFGMSRRLYSLKEYVKTHSGYLPWRWMAPESLRRFVFNEKTDVWAYGVTLWEIFTLGEIPYIGRDYSEKVLVEIENGLKPNEPQNNFENIYQVMQDCWAIHAEDRPTFKTIKLNILEKFPECSASSRTAAQNYLNDMQAQSVE